MPAPPRRSTSPARPRAGAGTRTASWPSRATRRRSSASSSTRSRPAAPASPTTRNSTTATAASCAARPGSLAPRPAWASRTPPRSPASAATALTVTASSSGKEVVHAITSLDATEATPAQLAALARRHWHIESCHWLRHRLPRGRQHRLHRRRPPGHGHTPQHRHEPAPPRRDHPGHPHHPGYKAATRPALSNSCRYRQAPIRLRRSRDQRPGGIAAITLFPPDSWRGAVTMPCPEQDDPRLRSSAAGQGWPPTRAIARVSGTPSISRLVIVAARAPGVPFDRSLSAMANTAP